MTSIISQDATPLKRCPTCPEPEENHWHPATPEFFYRSKTNKDRLFSQCKVCVRAYSNARYQIPEVHSRMMNYSKERDRNLDVRKRRLPQRRDYRKRRASQVMSRVRAHNYRARQKEVQGTYTPEQIEEQLKRQKYRCYYARCGFSRFKRIKENGKWKYLYHVEHTFPISRVAGMDIPANDMSYLVLACESCNDSKNNKFPWEWPEGGRLL